METDRLRYFCAIVDAGSITKAAELLGVSHSGLSKAMSVLQDELGFKVLSAKGRGLELTEKGKSLYVQSRKILEMINSLKGQTKIPENYLRIGLPEVLALASSGVIAHELKQALTIEDLDSGEIEARVLDGRNDFAFTFVPFPHKDIDHLKIATVTLSSFCRVDSFSGFDAEKIPYVIPATEIRDNPLSIRIRDGWNSNLNRYTPFRANSLSIALKMAQSGACAIYTPSFLVTQINGAASKGHQLVELSVSAQRRSQEKTQRDIFLVKRSADDESKPMKTAAKIVRQVCRT